MVKDLIIKLHKEHGLNPTKSTCVICGEETGEIVFLGDAYPDKAPVHMCISPYPCQKCKERSEKEDLVILVEFSEAPYANKNAEFTGRSLTLSGYWFQQVMNVLVPKQRLAWIDKQGLDKLNDVLTRIKEVEACPQ